MHVGSTNHVREHFKHAKDGRRCTEENIRVWTVAGSVELFTVDPGALNARRKTHQPLLQLRNPVLLLKRRTMHHLSLKTTTLHHVVLTNNRQSKPLHSNSPRQPQHVTYACNKKLLQ
jgi:hypothetical protein